MCVTIFDQSECVICRVIFALGRVVFRGICGEIFALFHACVSNFDTILPWKVVGTLYLDSSCVTFKYFAFLSVCDKSELLGHVQDSPDQKFGFGFAERNAKSVLRSKIRFWIHRKEHTVSHVSINI